MDFEFHPRVVPTVLAALMILCFALLGTWQLARFIEKSEMEDEWNARRSEPPSELTSAEAFDVEANDYRTVRAHGVVDTSRVAYYDHRRFRGEPGCLVASPMALRDGGTLVVVRGFVPHTRDERCTEQPLAAPAGDGALLAVVHHVKPNLADMPHRDQRTATQRWDTFDVTGTYGSWEITDGPVLPAVLVLDESHRGDPFPYASFEHFSEPYLTAMRHLNYAGTWFLLLLFAVGGWGAASMRRVPST